MALVEDLEPVPEWRQLTSGIREQFKKKLAERLVEPRIPASTLRGSSDRTKIKRAPPASTWSTRCGIARCWCWLWRWASGSAMLSTDRLTSAEA